MIHMHLYTNTDADVTRLTTKRCSIAHAQITKSHTINIR